MSRKLTQAVEQLRRRARCVYYEIVLLGHPCPACGGSLAMIGESRSQCAACDRVWDPTTEFQRCAACGGVPRLRIRRYRCSGCGEDVASRFVFDGLVFDAEYFRRAMAASRERKQHRREIARLTSTENRSGAMEAPELDLQSVPGLVDALNGLAAQGCVEIWTPATDGFDLKRYERHIQAHIGTIESSFEDIPPITDRARIDRIWRFIALIFLAHTGVIQLRQAGATILVRRHAN